MELLRKYRILVAITVLVLFAFCESGKGAHELYQTGIEKLNDGKHDIAYKYFKKAALKDPLNSEYNWAAFKTAPNQNEAFIHVKAAWDKGLKSPVVLIALASVAFHSTLNQKLQYAFSLFNGLPDSLKNDELRGDLFFKFGKPDSALVLWEKIQNESPKSELCNKIALCYQKKGDYGKLLSYLEKNRQKRMLNSSGYTMLMSLWALQYNYVKVDSLFDEVSLNGHSDHSLQVDYALQLIARSDLQRAQEILQSVLDSEKIDGLLKLRILNSLVFIYGTNRDSTNLKTFAKKYENNRSLGKDVREFCNVLLTDSNSVKRFEKIGSLYNRFPSDPILTLIYARQLFQMEKYNRADTIYRCLPPVFLYSPQILIEYAVVKSKLGKDDEAMQCISRLHQHNIFSRVSLELFRDLAFKKELFDKSSAAQKLLESKFESDVKVQWSGAVLALKLGKFDSAITILTDLSKKYPLEELFELTKISAIFISGDYNRVMQECSRSTFTGSGIKLLQARAMRKLGDQAGAQNAYSAALEKHQGDKNGIASELANFLFESGDLKTALSIYSQMIDSLEKSGKNDLLLATALNNYAWLGIQSENPDKKSFVSAAKKAAGIFPQNVEIVDTYANVLLKTGDYMSCIKVLSQKEFLNNEPKLLVYLGEAYEKAGDKNKAVRAYMSAIDLSEKNGTFSQINGDKLIEHVTDLKSEK